MSKLKTLLLSIICICSTIYINATDYKYIRTYDANGNIIHTANKDEYITINFMQVPYLGPTITYGCMWFPLSGGEWKYATLPNYTYNSTNNGWYIFVCSLGFSAEYIYLRCDLSCVRMTFLAGGHGKYREFIPAKRPTIDRLAPTR